MTPDKAGAGKESSTPASLETVIESVADVKLVKMRRGYDGLVVEVHPDGVADYLQSPDWKLV